ncbi:MAG: glycosyltransferase [Elusimicrobiota bacterium]
MSEASPAKRVLYVSTSTTVGGAEKTLYTLATLLDPKKFQVAGVLSLKHKGEYAKKLEEAGVVVRSFDLAGVPGLGELQKLGMFIHETRPDLVHALMYQAIQVCRAARMLGYAQFKLVSSPRVNYRTRGDWSLLIDGWLKGADDLLLTESDASRDYLVKKMKYKPEKVQRIYNGVDISGWSVSKNERARLRGRIRVKPDDILVGAVGRLDEQKGHAFLIEAVAQLRAANPVRCVILGDGPLRSKLQGLIASLGVSNHVLLLGERPDVRDWLSAFDVFVQPSLWEGLPNSLLEAMAIGLPVVATRVDGMPEVVRHEVSGLLCAPKDAQALANAVRDLASDPVQRRRLGESAQQIVGENFLTRDMIGAYETAYSKVLGI